MSPSPRAQEGQIRWVACFSSLREATGDLGQCVPLTVPPLVRRARPRDRGSPPVPSDGPGNCAGVWIQESFSISGSEKSPGNGTDSWQWPPASLNAACDLDTSSEGVVPSSGSTHGGEERPLSLQGGAALPSAPAEDLGPGPEAGTGCEALRGQAPGQGGAHPADVVGKPGRRQCPGAAVKKHHELGVFTEQKFILPQSGGQSPRSRCRQGRALFDPLGEDSSCLFQPFWASGILQSPPPSSQAPPSPLPYKDSGHWI